MTFSKTGSQQGWWKPYTIASAISRSQKQPHEVRHEGTKRPNLSRISMIWFGKIHSERPQNIGVIGEKTFVHITGLSLMDLIFLGNYQSDRIIVFKSKHLDKFHQQTWGQTMKHLSTFQIAHWLRCFGISPASGFYGRNGPLCTTKLGHLLSCFAGGSALSCKPSLVAARDNLWDNQTSIASSLQTGQGKAIECTCNASIVDAGLVTAPSQ